MVRTYPLICVLYVGVQGNWQEAKGEKSYYAQWRHWEIRSVEAPRNKENRGAECGVKGPISRKNKDILGWNKMMVKVGNWRQQIDKKWLEDQHERQSRDKGLFRNFQSEMAEYVHSLCSFSYLIKWLLRGIY